MLILTCGLLLGFYQLFEFYADIWSHNCFSVVTSYPFIKMCIIFFDALFHKNAISLYANCHFIEKENLNSVHWPKHQNASVVNAWNIVFQVNGVLPLLPLTFPLLWVLVCMYGEARVLLQMGSQPADWWVCSMKRKPHNSCL